MIQLNYADWNEAGEAPSGSRQAGDLYRKCREKDIPIFVMEPVKRGAIWPICHRRQNAILKQQRPDASPGLVGFALGSVLKKGSSP